MPQTVDYAPQIGTEFLTVTALQPNGEIRIIDIHDEEQFARDIGVKIPPEKFSDVGSACEAAGLTVLAIHDAEGNAIYTNDSALQEEIEQAAAKPRNHFMKASIGAAIVLLVAYMGFHKPSNDIASDNIPEPPAQVSQSQFASAEQPTVRIAMTASGTCVVPELDAYQAAATR